MQYFLVILENFCYCLIQKTLGELPDFEVMTWQLCHLQHSAMICVQITLSAAKVNIISLPNNFDCAEE